MNKNLTITIEADELKQLLLKYYQDLYKDESVSIEEKSGKEFVGPYEFPNLVTKLNLKRNIKIGKYPAVSEQEIDDETIKKVLSSTLEDTGYQVEDIKLITKRELVGLYEIEEICFKGVRVVVKQKENQKQLCKQLK